MSDQLQLCQFFFISVKFILEMATPDQSTPVSVSEDAPESQPEPMEETLAHNIDETHKNGVAEKKTIDKEHVGAMSIDLSEIETDSQSLQEANPFVNSSNDEQRTSPNSKPERLASNTGRTVKDSLESMPSTAPVDNTFPGDDSISMSTTFYSNEKKVLLLKLQRCKATDEELASALEDAFEADANEMSEVKTSDMNIVEVERNNVTLLSPKRSANRCLPFTCQVCLERFYSVPLAMEHSLNIHGVELTTKAVLDTNVGCPHCGRKCSRGDAQRNHERRCTHTKALPLTNERVTDFISALTVPKSSESERKMRMRRSVHHGSVRSRGQKVFLCSICRRVLNSKYLILTHLRVVHKKKSPQGLYKEQYKCRVKISKPKCSMCSYTSSSWSTIYRHRRQVHPSNAASTLKNGKTNRACSICKNKFSSLSALWRHKKSAHKSSNAKVSRVQTPVQNADAYFCHLCGSTISKSCIYKHMRRIHQTTPFAIPVAPAHKTNSNFTPCLYCGGEFTYRTLHKHIRREHKEFCQKSSQLVNCTQCALIFQNQPQLDYHIKTSHKSLKKETAEGPKSPGGKEKLVFPCSKCGQVLSSLINLEKHMRNLHYIKGSDSVVIQGVPKVQCKDPTPECKQCEILFDQWSDLYSHLRKGQCKSHQQSTSEYYCTICCLSFRNENKLLSHNDNFHKKHNHSSSKGSTTIKSRKRAQQNVSKSAVETSTSEKPFICSFCDKEFQAITTWYTHMYKAHRLKRSKCDEMREQLELERSTKPKEEEVSNSVKEEPVDHCVDEVLKNPPSKTGDDCSVEEQIFSCSICDMGYHTEQSLTRHYRKRHKAQKEVKQGPIHLPVTTIRKKTMKKPSGPLLVCHICDITTLYKNNLHRHYKRIHGYSDKDIIASLTPSGSTSILQTQHQLPSTNSLKPSETSSFAANVSTDFSSSDSSDWMPPNLPSTSSSSSDDSSSDDEERLFRPQVSKQQVLSSSSSSSSSDSSSDDDVGTNVLCSIEYSKSASKSSVKDNQVTPTSRLSTNNPNFTPPAVGDQLLTGDILQLDENIFSVTPKNMDQVTAKNMDQVTAKSMSTESQIPKMKKKDCDLILDLANIATIEYQVDDGSEHSGKQLSSNNDKKALSNSAIEKINQTSVVAQYQFNKEMHENLQTDESKYRIMKHCIEAKSSELAKPPITRLPKSTPVAILRPFSSVPETNVFEPSLTSTSGSSNLASVFPPRSSSASAALQTISSVNSTGGNRIPIGDTVTKTCNEIDPSLLSYPVYLVDSKDFLLPFVYNNVYHYRRIQPSYSERQQSWHFSQWYEDLSCCNWVVVALLPEPMQHVKQIDCFMSWMLEKDLVTSSLHKIPTKLPRIISLNWIVNPDITHVEDYKVPSYSAICFLCGSLVRSFVEMNTHMTNGHSLCKNCNQFQTSSHHCSSLLPSKSTQRPQVKFLALSAVNSKQYSPISSVPTTLLNNQFEQIILEKAIKQLDSAEEAGSSQHVESLSKAPACAAQLISQNEVQQSSSNSASNSLKSLDSPTPVVDKKLRRQKYFSSIVPEITPGLKDSSACASKDYHDYVVRHSVPYNCSFCNLNFLLKVQYEHHMLTLHKKCTICSLTFQDRQSRSDHITNEHNHFICLACDHTCSTDQAVKSHIIKDHVNMETGLFSCIRCPNTQVHPEAIIEHLKQDDAEMHSKCHLCDSALPAQASLQLAHFFSHVLHSSESYCLICRRLYLEPWSLRRHIVEAGHYFCGYCLFTSPGSFSHHLCAGIEINRTVRQEAKKELSRLAQWTRYCNLCCKLVTGESLKQHSDLYHKQYRLQCEICGQRFQFDHQRSFHMGLHKKKKTWHYSLCAGCLLVSASLSLNNEYSYKVIESCDKCRNANQEKATNEDENALTATESGTISNTTVEVSVSVEHVKECDFESEDVQLMLDGKLYNFVSDDERDESRRKSFGGPGHAEKNFSAALDLDDGSDQKTDTENDDCGGALVIDESCSVGKSPVKNPITNSERIKDIATEHHPNAAMTNAPYSCELCSFTCKLKMAMNKHMAKKHGQ